jgi:hypothetical protein
MADVLSTAFGLNEPEVGGSANTWGGKLNSDLAMIDRLLSVLNPNIAVVDPTSGVMNVALGMIQQLTVTGDVTLSTINVPGRANGSTILLLAIINGSSATVTYPSGFNFLGGVTPVLGSSDLLLAVTGDAGVNWTVAHLGVVDPGMISGSTLSFSAVASALNLSRCRAIMGGNQTVSPNADTIVNFTGTDAYDDGNLHDPTTNSGQRIVMPAGFSGLIVLDANLSVGNMTGLTAASTVIARIHKQTGVVIGKTAVVIGASPSGPIDIHVHAEAKPAAADYFYVSITLPGTGSPEVLSGDADLFGSHFTAHQLP